MNILDSSNGSSIEYNTIVYQAIVYALTIPLFVLTTTGRLDLFISNAVGLLSANQFIKPNYLFVWRWISCKNF